MTLTSIMAFIKTAEYGNFTKAAQELYMTQQALSYQIAQLEEELGTALFIRGKPLQLTPVGELCLREAKRIVVHYERMLNQIENHKGGLNGSLKVGGLYFLNRDSFLNSFRNYSIENPNVRIDVRVEFPGKLMSGFNEGLYDVIFIGKNEAKGLKNVNMIQVMKNEIKIIVSKTHPLAERESVHLSELADEMFILLDRTVAAEGVDRQISLCRKYDFSPKCEYRVKNRDELRFLVGLGKGIGFSFTAEKEDPMVKTLALEGVEDDYWNTVCVYHNNENRSEVIGYINSLKENCFN